MFPTSLRVRSVSLDFCQDIIISLICYDTNVFGVNPYPLHLPCFRWFVDSFDLFESVVHCPLRKCKVVIVFLASLIHSHNFMGKSYQLQQLQLFHINTIISISIDFRRKDFSSVVDSHAIKVIPWGYSFHEHFHRSTFWRSVFRVDCDLGLNPYRFHTHFVSTFGVHCFEFRECHLVVNFFDSFNIRKRPHWRKNWTPCGLSTNSPSQRPNIKAWGIILFINSSSWSCDTICEADHSIRLARMFGWF